MDGLAFAGPLLRMLRLEKNWSQETMCRGICKVSYLSKIEQGKVQANEALLGELFERLNVQWQSARHGEGARLCAQAYEVIFSGDSKGVEECSARLLERWDELSVGPCYLDFLALRAYFSSDAALIPEAMKPLLDARQRCLLELAAGNQERAAQLYPCALTVLCAGAKAYRDGNYTLALENLQRSYDMACREGYVWLMLDSQVYIANCYSDLRNVTATQAHSTIAKRLAQALGAAETERVIDYNRVCTQMECGDYEAGYSFFSTLESKNVLDLHKLAVCCEKLGKYREALAALNRAERNASGVEAAMCALVAYRIAHPDYLHDDEYGKLLLDTFAALRKERSAGYARFHLPWVEEWCTANRQYRLIYEIMRDFT